MIDRTTYRSMSRAATPVTICWVPEDRARSATLVVAERSREGSKSVQFQVLFI